MKVIDSIRIKYFRSILTTTRGNISHIPVSDLNIVVGNNDAGKSNFLKALNLFFNHTSKPYEDFNFFKEFTLSRRNKRKEVSRIEIELIINPPSKQGFRNNGSVKWTKTWYEQSNEPDEEISYINGSEFIADNRSSYYKWLKKLKFKYVPAIKSKFYFDNLMFDLYDVLQKDTQQLEKEFNQQIRKKTKTITGEINSRLKLDSILQYNGSFRDLFNALEFGTDSGKIMLSERGDGIQVRHIPIILQNMAEAELADYGMREPCANTIWGFEEPENNLEFSSAQKLADTFLEYIEKIHFENEAHSKFDEGIQIFISTHSPIFYSLEGHNINKIYVEKDESEHSTIKPIPTDLRSKRELEKTMGLDPLLELSHRWSELSNIISSQNSKLDELEFRLKQLSRPVVITEGKTDN